MNIKPIILGFLCTVSHIALAMQDTYELSIENCGATSQSMVTLKKSSFAVENQKETITLEKQLFKFDWNPSKSGCDNKLENSLRDLIIKVPSGNIELKLDYNYLMIFNSKKEMFRDILYFTGPQSARYENESIEDVVRYKNVDVKPFFNYAQHAVKLFDEELTKRVKTKKEADKK